MNGMNGMSMTKRIRVVVTADDIERGKRCDLWSCPIALALFRVTGAKWEVGDHSASEIGRVRETEVELPDAAASFVRDYDNGEFPEPFEFELELRTQEAGAL
jgi:hypothetical protein